MLPNSNISRGEELHEVWIIVEESLIFKMCVIFLIDFPNIYNDYLLANVTDSFILLFW